MREITISGKTNSESTLPLAVSMIIERRVRRNHYVHRGRLDLELLLAGLASMTQNLLRITKMLF